MILFILALILCVLNLIMMLYWMQEGNVFWALLAYAGLVFSALGMFNA